MEIIKLLYDGISSKKITHTIINIVGILLIGFLFIANQPIWQNVFETIWKLIKPFAIGFTIAFVLNPFVNYIQKYVKNRSMAILVIFIIGFGTVILLAWQIIPMLYKSIENLIPSLYAGLTEIQDFMKSNWGYDISSLTKHIQTLINDAFSGATVLNTTIDVLNQVLINITNFLIYIILALYMTFNYENIRRLFGRIARKIDKNLPLYLIRIDRSLILYVKAFMIGAIVQGIMAGLMYIIVGNENWLVLGLLSGVSSIFPYVGPIAANILGLVTSLGLEPAKIVILIILIFIQSNVMGYIITPRIYSNQIDLSIMWVLFGLLSGSALFGIWGMVIAMPVLVSIKIIFRVYQERHPKLKIEKGTN